MPDGYRIVLDVAPGKRRVEEWIDAPLNMPDPEIFLWSLTEDESIDRYWIGTANDPADAGRVVIPPGPLDPNAHDYLEFSTIDGEARRTGYAIWPYSTYETFAQDDAGAHTGLSAEQWLTYLLVARASNEMRADLLATTNPRLLSSQAAYVTEANPCSASEAAGFVGLYLRSMGRCPVIGPERLVLDERSTLCLAVEELLPSWRVWASELIQHTVSTGNDTGTVDLLPQLSDTDRKRQRVPQVGSTVVSRRGCSACVLERRRRVLPVRRSLLLRIFEGSERHWGRGSVIALIGAASSEPQFWTQEAKLDLNFERQSPHARRAIAGFGRSNSSVGGVLPMGDRYARGIDQRSGRSGRGTFVGA